jgi:Tfp pilus assembly protein PilV
MNKISKNEKGFGIVEVLLVILILVVIGAVGYAVYHNNHKTNMTSATNTTRQKSTTSSSTNSQTSENKDNTIRTIDANIILAAISNFEANNEGLFPSSVAQASNDSVYFCKTNCNSSNSSTANLSYYTPTDIYDEESISGLAPTIPNDNTVYVIDNATCTNSTFTGTEAGGTFVVVYALQKGNSITQKCLTNS